MQPQWSKQQCNTGTILVRWKRNGPEKLISAWQHTRFDVWEAIFGLVPRQVSVCSGQVLQQLWEFLDGQNLTHQYSKKHTKVKATIFTKVKSRATSEWKIKVKTGDYSPISRWQTQKSKSQSFWLEKILSNMYVNGRTGLVLKLCRTETSKVKNEWIIKFIKCNINH